MLFIRRPERWVREISKHGANVSGGPNFAYELLIERAPQLEGEALDLSQWKVAVSGAEHVRADTLDRFCATYERYGFKRESFCPSRPPTMSPSTPDCDPGRNPSWRRRRDVQLRWISHSTPIVKPALPEAR